MPLRLTSPKVRRVLECLNGPRSNRPYYQHQSLEELVSEYNLRFPPTLELLKLKSFSMTKKEMKSIVDFLVHESLVKGEVFSFIRMVELPRPEKYYSITPKGINHILGKRQ